MTYISSDTNIWIDFMTIEKLELPFRIPYTFLMYELPREIATAITRGNS